jgi:mono/diheme cytochrome c family protein
MRRLGQQPIVDFCCKRIARWAHLGCCGIVVAVLFCTPYRTLADDTALVQRGKYIFAAAGGCGCHTTKEGGLNAGGRKFSGPFGVVYGTNITPDKETGIGTWSEQQFIDAMRYGVRPNGEKLLPVMPYPSFRLMADADLKALWAYLRSLPAIKRPNQPRKASMPFLNLFLAAWNKVYGGRGEPPRQAPSEGVERGKYLVWHVAHCGECHTPRGMTGALDNTRFLAGTNDGPEHAVVANITPDKETGIGTWSESDIVDYLQTGMRPDGDNAQGLMAEVIKGTSVGYKDLSVADRRAIAAYLRTVPAIVNRISSD